LLWSGHGGLTFVLRQGGPRACNTQQRGKPALASSTLVSSVVCSNPHE
jgi:hypothetical protein